MAGNVEGEKHPAFVRSMGGAHMKASRRRMTSRRCVVKRHAPWISSVSLHATIAKFEQMLGDGCFLLYFVLLLIGGICTSAEEEEVGMILSSLVPSLFFAPRAKNRLGTRLDTLHD